MSSIETYLQYIASKVWARDVRTAIVNAIRQCYDDVHNPTLNTEALQAALQAKIDAGQMAALTIGDRTITAAKLALGVIPTPDATLSQSGVPADAKKTGDEITAIKADLENCGLSDAAKAALLACLNCVGYEQNDGRQYYNALVSALYPDTFPKIVATFTPGTHVVYTDDALSTLKSYLAVKYYETSDSQGETVSANDYTLSGTLTEGQSSVFVSYNGMTTAFTVDAVDYYNIWHWSVSEGNLIIVSGKALNYNINVTPNRLELQDSDARKSITTTRGKTPIYPSNDKYPIPIPVGATKATINITPNTQYIGPRIVKNEGSYYSNVSPKGWLQNGSVITFDSGDDLFLAIPTKYDSAGSTYPTAPTNIEVIFE